MKHRTLALFLFLSLPLAVLGLAPLGAAAASAPPPSHSDETHPWVMQQTAQQVATANVGSLSPFQPATAGRSNKSAVGPGGDLHRRVFGYGLLSSIASTTYGYPTWNFDLLSTVAVFGLDINSDGTIAQTGNAGWTEWNSSDMTGLLNTAHQHQTKVELTIILQDFSSGTPNMCAGLSNRATTVSQTLGQVQAKGVDGVNIDYEGLNGSCPNGQTPRAMMTDLARQMRAALPVGDSLSIATYASSAGDPAGFFDIPMLNNYVDTFFVMAYDSDYSNYGYAPINCSRYCLNPVAPLTGYYYNDTRAAGEYTGAVAASKVILGVPYYSRGACVSAWAYNAYPVAGSSTWALDYFGTTSMAGDPTNTQYQSYTDPNDPAGQEKLARWYSTNTSCHPMEMYFDDPTSLGKKYDLVNSANLGGVGIWNLNQGGGNSDLWSLLRTHFATHFNVAAPGGVVAGSAFNFSVTAVDPNGNVATGYSGTVHFTSDDAQATLPPDTTVTQGAGSFTATLRTSGSHSLTATDATSVIPGTASIAVTAAAAATLSMAAPGTAATDTPFTVTLTARDQYGNVASGDNDPITFSSSDSLAHFPPSPSLAAGAGTYPVTLGTPGNMTLGVYDGGAGLHPPTVGLAVTRGGDSQAGASAAGSRASSTPVPAPTSSPPSGRQTIDAAPTPVASTPAPSQPAPSAATTSAAAPTPTAASANLTPAQSPDRDSRLTALLPAGGARGQRPSRGWLQGARHAVAALLHAVMGIL
jgi:spore germination protein YaaH